MINFLNYKVIIFDLDDTIYDEHLYLEKAYNYIGECLCSSLTSCGITPHEISTFLLLEFEKEGREGLYEKLINKYDVVDFTLDNFLECMRTTPLKQGSIKIRPYMNHLINRMIKEKKMIFILTNGNIKQQKNKINSLNIPHRNKIKVYYASSKGLSFEKPNPYFLNLIKEVSSSHKSEIVFIGDSEIDKKTAFNSDIDFVNVQNLEPQSKY